MRVTAWRALPDALIRAQVVSALQGFPVAAVKTGLLPGEGAIRAVARSLSEARSIPLVVDPVLASSSGTRFLSKAGIRALGKHLLPIATVITPNWPEAAELSGLRVGTQAQAEKAAHKLAADYRRPVLVKGGHGTGKVCRDCLATPDDVTVWFEVPRVATRNTHGTGCVLSAAIASWLGRGADLVSSVRLAQSFLHRALVRGRGLDWGPGRGPAFYGSR